MSNLVSLNCFLEIRTCLCPKKKSVKVVRLQARDKSHVGMALSKFCGPFKTIVQ